MVRLFPVASGPVSPDFSALLVVVALLVADSVFDDVVSVFFSSVLVAEPHPTSAKLNAMVAIPTPVTVVSFLIGVVSPCWTGFLGRDRSGIFEACLGTVDDAVTVVPGPLEPGALTRFVAAATEYQQRRDGLVQVTG